jgi:electron transfer flavoprotein alpha subunit
MSKPVFVISEQRDGVFRKVSYEVVSEGRRLADQLGTTVVAIVLGSGIDGLGETLGFYGADKVVVADSEIFKNYSAEGYTATIVEAVKNVDPEIILLPASVLGKDLAPRIAAKLDVGLATDCIEFSLEESKLQAVRPMYAGKVISTFKFNSSPQMATMRPNIFTVSEPDTSKSPEVENATVTISAGDLKAVVKEVVASEGGKLDVSEADIIVSGGRGMKGPENFTMLEELAGLLNGAIGASRSAVDSDWRPHSDQVGQTGKTVSPNLYIACGISGAIQHLAGMSSSKCIVAINKDPDAPIFQKADYGIVGDLFEVVPVLTEEIKKVVE